MEISNRQNLQGTGRLSREQTVQKSETLIPFTSVLTYVTKITQRKRTEIARELNAALPFVSAVAKETGVEVNVPDRQEEKFWNLVEENDWETEQIRPLKTGRGWADRKRVW